MISREPGIAIAANREFHCWDGWDLRMLVVGRLLFGNSSLVHGSQYLKTRWFRIPPPSTFGM